MFWGEYYVWNGDSDGGWVGRLRKDADKKMLETNFEYDCDIMNLGIPGDSTEGLLKRIEGETKVRISKDGETRIVISIGINDSQFIHSTNSYRISEEAFANNISKILDIAKKHVSKIAYIGITPVDETRTDPIPWNTEKSYRNERIELFNNIMKQACEEKNVPFLDLFHEFKKLDGKEFLVDGLHPHPRLYKTMYERIKPFLIAQKIIE